MCISLYVRHCGTRSFVRWPEGCDGHDPSCRHSSGDGALRCVGVTVRGYVRSRVTEVVAGRCCHLANATAPTLFTLLISRRRERVAKVLANTRSSSSYGNLPVFPGRPGRASWNFLLYYKLTFAADGFIHRLSWIGWTRGRRWVVKLICRPQQCRLVLLTV
jgi:hypothetical protein